jgi:hypothetical protein
MAYIINNSEKSQTEQFVSIYDRIASCLAKIISINVCLPIAMLFEALALDRWKEQTKIEFLFFA